MNYSALKCVRTFIESLYNIFVKETWNKFNKLSKVSRYLPQG